MQRDYERFAKKFLRQQDDRCVADRGDADGIELGPLLKDEVPFDVGGISNNLFAVADDMNSGQRFTSAGVNYLAPNGFLSARGRTGNKDCACKKKLTPHGGEDAKRRVKVARQRMESRGYG